MELLSLDKTHKQISFSQQSQRETTVSYLVSQWQSTPPPTAHRHIQMDRHRHTSWKEG